MQWPKAANQTGTNYKQHVIGNMGEGKQDLTESPCLRKSF